MSINLFNLDVLKDTFHGIFTTSTIYNFPWQVACLRCHSPGKHPEFQLVSTPFRDVPAVIKMGSTSSIVVRWTPHKSSFPANYAFGDSRIRIYRSPKQCHKEVSETSVFTVNHHTANWRYFPHQIVFIWVSFGDKWFNAQKRCCQISK